MAQTAMTTFDPTIPSDMARVAGKGLGAMEAFLDTLGEEVPEERFRRLSLYARVGATAVGKAIGYMSALNNRAAIELARDRMRQAPAPTGE